MNIVHIFSCLVPPGKAEPVPNQVRGTEIPLNGDLLYNMLSDVFRKSDEECTIPIRFLHAEDGTQQNPVRSEIINLIRTPSLALAQQLGSRLHLATTDKSGLGLLFLLLGESGAEKKVVISRFPANQGVLAEARRDVLELAFVEKVFLKGIGTYKAALYRGRSLDTGFWDGTAVDKQLKAGANYWIRNFLGSDFRTTSKAGSRRLATALRDAAKSVPSFEAKHEIVSLATIIPRFTGRPISIRSVFEDFNVSQEARQAIESKLPNDQVIDSTFQLDADEFRQHAAFRAVELDNGGILTAPAGEFDSAFKQEVVDSREQVVKFTSVGKIVDEQVKRRR
jgi:hypothetical protein